MTHRPHFFKKSVYLFLSAGILIIFQLIDSFFVFNSLVNSGVPALEAMSLKGSFDRDYQLFRQRLSLRVRLSHQLFHKWGVTD